jgi:hypothetical protein
MTEKILGNKMILQLCDRLGFQARLVRRIVIDAQHSSVVKVYVEFFGDERLLDIEIPGGEIVMSSPEEVDG